VTIVQLRAKGMSWMRLPFFVWAQFVTSFPSCCSRSAARSGWRSAVDGPAGRHELLHHPAALPSGQADADRGQRQPAALAAPVLVPRAPEVYVLILPAMGIVAEIIANTPKPLWGYKALFTR
jgi:cytochrome c oxidase subunit 1